jgi:ferredoxin--NADP+ reductase
MSYPIVKREALSNDVFRILVEAPEIAKKHRPGQFVVLRVNETGERIPLTIADSDAEKGLITMIFQVVGKSTMLLSDQKVGDKIEDLCGPLGTATHIEKFGTVACVGGGIGVAPLYPIAKGLKKAGNRLVNILGARTKSLLILEKEMAELADKQVVSTDDGSYGIHGLVTDTLKAELESDDPPKIVFSIGPLPMMKFVSKLTKEYNVPTWVSLNSIMVDGTGMCGGCRVTVGGEQKFTCVDGPEFDGHKVDFDELGKRLAFYREQEAVARKEYESGEAHRCACGGGK